MTGTPGRELPKIDRTLYALIETGFLTGTGCDHIIATAILKKHVIALGKMMGIKDVSENSGYRIERIRKEPESPIGGPDWKR